MTNKKKTILITGSSRGIGRAIALKAASNGWNVIIHGKTDSSTLRKTRSEVQGSTSVFFDVSDREEVKKVISELGHIDVLVNNAGVAKNFLSELSDMREESAIEEFKTNVLGTLYCAEAVIEKMSKKKAGKIINIASIKGHHNLATMSTLTYAATKSGVISITKALAKSYPNLNICSVSPGYVETDQVKDWNSQTFERINKGTILGRIGKPNEVAGLVMFLAGDESTYITGTDYLVDGGYEISGK